MSHKKKKTTFKKSSGDKNKVIQKSISKPLPDMDAVFRQAVHYHQSGAFEQAESLYRQILEGNPNHSDALHLLGVISHQTGKKDIAEGLILQAIRLNPERANYHNNLGILFQEEGKWTAAIACYQKALQIRPEFADAYNNMGFALQDQKKFHEAIASYQKAIRLNPNYAEAYNNLGTAFKDDNQLESAVSSYQKAVEIKPDYVEAYNNMGYALKEQGKPDEALGCYQKALQIRPRYSDAYNSMGILFRECGKFDEAAACYQKAIEIKPDYAEAYNNLGSVLKDRGRFNEALACCQKSLQFKPDNYSAYLNMGNTLQDLGRLDDAIACYHKALELKPDYAVAYDNMRNAYIYQGKLEEAVLCCEKSLSIRHDPGIEVRKVMMIPVIYESGEQILHYREKIVNELELLKAKGIRLHDPNAQVGSTNFYLAYHGMNDRELQQKIASFYIQVCPELAWTPNKERKARKPGDKINIGVVSMHLYNMSQQTIGKLNRGIIRNLSREKFHVRLFRFPGGETHLIKAIAEGADEVIDLPSELKPAREMIAAYDTDILFYPDIGMDSLTYFLAFSRLAPVQCMTWGHPVTTGIPNMDYFISSQDLELPGAEDHYSERLVRLSRLGVYYYPPELPDTKPSREKFAFPEDCNLYACPHAPFKFHPDFDLALAAILRSDPKALLILIEGGTFKHWAELLLKRFSKTFPEAIDRVRFMPAMPTKDFMSLMATADVLLEPPYFGGGNTTYEALACGVPFVTWPGPFMRGRVTFALYRQMGVLDCVANNPQSYIEIAIRLANDKAWREEVRAKIRANSHLIFEDIEAVRELERFFESAVRQHER